MKTIFTAFLLCIAALSFAQPTISTNAIIQLGENEPTSFFSLNAQNWQPSQSGENQIWDFGSLPGGAECDYLALDPSESMYFDSFPNSDIYFVCSFTDSDGNLTEQHSFYQIQGDKLQLSGNVSLSPSSAAFDSIFIVFSDPLDWGTFPYTFEDETEDTFAARVTTYSNNQTIVAIQSGTSKHEVDSYGTLTTPAGTFENTIRVKRTELAENSIPGIPFSTPQESYRYTWYGENEKGVILNLDSIVIKDFTGSVVNTTYNGSFRISGPSVTSLENTLDVKLEIYPNPLQKELNISIENIENYNMVIFDLLGSEIPFTVEAQTHNAYRIQIDEVSTYTKVLYLTLIDMHGNKQFTRPLLISHF